MVTFIFTFAFSILRVLQYTHTSQLPMPLQCPEAFSLGVCSNITALSVKYLVHFELTLEADGVLRTYYHLSACGYTVFPAPFVRILLSQVCAVGLFVAPLALGC